MKLGKIVGPAALLAALSFAMPSRADLVVTIQNPVFVSSGGATLDVFIRSDAAGGDLLNFFQYQFQIALVSGLGRFDFMPYDYSTLTTATNPDYVFAGLGTNPIASVSTDPNGLPNDTFSGGDSRNDSDNTLIGSSDVLLTRLVIGQMATNLIPTEGSTFSITLVPPSGTTDFSSTTFFGYSQNDPSLPNFGEFLPNTFTSAPILITVSAVPEPASLSALACGLATLGAWRARRSRMAKAA